MAQDREFAPEHGEKHVHGMRRKKWSGTRRTKRIHLLLSDAEWHMLLEIADEFGMNISDVFRKLIRDEMRKYRRNEYIEPLVPRRNDYDKEAECFEESRRAR
jgi:DNA-dependent RNA polymerase auxiliary subunit epsilon